MFDFGALEERLTAHVTARMVELARLKPGQRVVDVGCGDGVVARAALARVTPGGSVHGVDPDAGAIERGRSARESGLSFEVSTAEAFRCAEPFDAAFARWSLASMADPSAAVRSIALALKPGAPWVFATWASAEWWSIPRRVIERLASLPARPAGAPGALRFANVGEAVTLVAPWFEVEVTEQLETPVVEGPPERLTAWVEHVFGAWLKTVPDVNACRAELRREFEPLSRLSGTTHLVLARRSLRT